MKKQSYIEGKKIRGSAFYESIYIFSAILLFFVLSVVFSDLTPYTLVVQIMAPLLLIPILPVLFYSRKVLFILSKDRLYYFMTSGMEYTVLDGYKRKVKSANGYILYSDIKRYEYTPYTYNRYQHTLSKYVILYGEKFEFKIVGVGKSFIKQLESKMLTSQNSDYAIDNPKPISDSYIPQNAREGLWKEIWDSFQREQLGEIFGDCKIMHIEMNEVDDVIDVFIKRNDQQIDFNLDATSIFMSTPCGDTDEMIDYERIRDVNTLFNLMRDFIYYHS